MHPRRPALVPSALLLVGAGIGAHGVLQPGRLLLGLATSCVLLALWARRRSPRLAATALAMALLGIGVVLALHDRTESERRGCRYFPQNAHSIELQFRGVVLEIAERTIEGDRLILVTGRAEQRPELPRLTVRLRVAGSPAAPTAGVDRLEVGDGVRLWCRLFRPRGLGNPDSIDPQRILNGRGVDAWGSVKSARLVEPDDTAGRTVNGRGAGRFKREARRRLDKMLEGRSEVRALAGAMLLGDRAMLEPATVRALRQSGLIHLVAISGLHVGLVALLAIGLIERCPLPGPVRLALLCVLLIGFGQLVGLRASVARATLGAAVLQTGRFLERSGDPLNTLAWVALVLVLLSPGAVVDPGLQLTVLASAGILIAIGRVRGRRIAGLGLVRVSAGAYLATAPLSALHFGWLAPAALVANLGAIPLCTTILAAGYAGLLLFDIPLVCRSASILTILAAEALLRVSDLVGRFAPAAFPVARPAALTVASYYVCCVTWSAIGPDGRTVSRRLVAFVLALCLVWIHNGPPPPPTPVADVALIDVGQGQALLARRETGGALLIDVGGSHNPRFDTGERIVLPFLLRFVGRRIDYLVLSHDHLDHVGGAAALIRELELGELCVPPGYQRSQRMNGLAQDAIAAGVALRLCVAGERLAGGFARVVGPSPEHSAMSVNDRSVALRLGRPGNRLLVPGDLEQAGELAATRTGLPLAADALVLSHHGSRTGSTHSFLERVRPRLALISCGFDNRFGHPHVEAIRRVRQSAVGVWRTDRDGAVWLTEGEAGWSVRASRR